MPAAGSHPMSAVEPLPSGPGEDDLDRLREQIPGPYCLFVGDLAFEASGEAVERLFALRYSAVMEAYVISERPSGRSRGYGFVKLSDMAQAQQAIAEMNNTLFMGRRIRVSAAGPKPPPGSRIVPPRPSLMPGPNPDRQWQPIAGPAGPFGDRPYMPAGPRPAGGMPGQLAAPARQQSGAPRQASLSIVGFNVHSGILSLYAPGVRLSWLCSTAESAGEVSCVAIVSVLLVLEICFESEMVCPLALDAGRVCCEGSGWNGRDFGVCATRGGSKGLCVISAVCPASRESWWPTSAQATDAPHHPAAGTPTAWPWLDGTP
jgi:hypothetical protein